MDGAESLPAQAERDRVLEGLARGFSENRISVEEFERRATLAQRAGDRDSLEALIADLPQPAPGGGEVAAAGSPGRSAKGGAENGNATGPASRDDAMGAYSVREGQYGQQSLACMMGSRTVRGEWLQGDRVDSFTMMGETVVDLRGASLPGGPIRINSFVCMGEMRVIVPEGLPVRLNAFPFMGSVEVKEGVSQRVEPGRPHVVIEGFAFMGSLVVSPG